MADFPSDSWRLVQSGRRVWCAMGLLSRHFWLQATRRARARTIHPRERTAWAFEAAVAKMVRSLDSVRHVHRGIRIPDPDRPQGAGEIDVVVITDAAIVLLEVKHWRGEIRLVDGDLVQGERRTKPVLSKLVEKVENLKRVDRAIAGGPIQQVLSYVVMTSPICRLTDEVGKLGQVVLLKDLSERLLMDLSHCDPMGESAIERLDAMMTRFGTWDTIHFDGGEMIAGDIEPPVPHGWSRESTRSIFIEIDGGWLATLFRGPRLKVRTVDWAGSMAESRIEPGALLHHVPPWATTGETEFPIEILSEIRFGVQRKFSWDATHELGWDGGGRDGPDPAAAAAVVDDGPGPGEDGAGAAAAVRVADPLDRFEEGGVHVGTVIKHLRDAETGRLYGVLVELVPRQVMGKIHARSLRDMNPEMFDMFYAEGREVTVRIRKIRGKKAIDLEPAD